MALNEQTRKRARPVVNWPEAPVMKDPADAEALRAWWFAVRETAEAELSRLEKRIEALESQ